MKTKDAKPTRQKSYNHPKKTLQTLIIHRLAKTRDTYIHFLTICDIVLNHLVLFVVGQRKGPRRTKATRCERNQTEFWKTICKLTCNTSTTTKNETASPSKGMHINMGMRTFFFRVLRTLGKPPPSPLRASR